MDKRSERRCINCLLTEDPAGHLLLDDQGVCSLCRQKGAEERMDWQSLEKIFTGTIDRNRGKGRYDGVVMMSGGKDSAYLAWSLKKKYGLNVIGVVNDIHYEYQDTFDNARDICDRLDIPLVENDLSGDLMKAFFRFLFMEREIRDRGCGQVCNYCGRMMIRAAADYAKENGIPMVFSGHNPEQVVGMGQNFEIDKKRLLRKEILNRMIRENAEKIRTLIRERQLEYLLPFFPVDLFPEGVEGLFMYQHFPYEPIKMMETIERELDWKPIKKLSGTYIASGCRLAHLWMKIATLNDTPNYVDFELSAQIRSGVLSRKLVEQFYDEAYDPSDEIEKLLSELSISSIGELL